MATVSAKSVCISTQPLAMGGGVGREVELIADQFLRSGLEVVVVHPENLRRNLFYSEEFSPYNEKLLENRVSVRTFFPVYFAACLLYGLRMRRRLPETDFFLVIGSSALEATPFLFAGRDYACLAATTFWDEWRRVKRLKDVSRPLPWLLRVVNTFTYPLTRAVERACYKKARSVAAISTHTKKNIEKQFSMNGIAVIHPPVDANCFSDHPRIKGERYVLSIGRLDPRKGLGTLLRAFAASVYGGRLVIGGIGPELSKLKELAEDLGVRERVEFVGFVAEEKKYSLIQHADAFILTSEQEGFGITVLEAMAMRTPVIATKCGGPEDVVVDGETGFLADVGDWQQIASIIDKVTSGYDELMIEKAFRTAEKSRPAAVVEQLLDLHFGQTVRSEGT